jgi:hypothetical protein
MDFHAFDEAVLKLINVLDEGVFKNIAREVAHLLTDVYDHTCIGFDRDAQ